MRLLEEYELKGQMERERERNQIIEIIAKSRRPIAPFEIKDVLDKIGVYENQFPMGKGNNKSIETTEESMPDRTIRYWCSELTKEGILQRDGEHNSYLISDKAAEELRHFGGIFGTEALHELLTLLIKTTTADKSIAELVNRFGALVLYAFIEATRPFEDKTMSAEAKDKTALSWVRNAIPVEEMFNQFLAGFVSDIKRKDDDDNANESSKYEFDREKVGELSESLQNLRIITKSQNIFFG
jgi:hypothetical protein